MKSIILNLRSKSESYRHKVAFFTASAVTLAILVTWAGARGYIGLPSGTVAYEPQNQSQLDSGQAASVAGAQSPFDNSMSALSAAFNQFGDEFRAVKESLYSVLVPFMSGIEVYQSK